MALMGTSVGIPTASTEKAVVFVEDMTVEEAAKAGAIAPPGLENLGQLFSSQILRLVSSFNFLFNFHHTHTHSLS
jgi:hypothetical protein